MLSNPVARGLAGALSACVLPAAASGFPPVTNHASLARSFALPVLGDSAVRAAGSAAWQTQFTLVSEFELQNFGVDGTCGDPECLRLDGETYRLGLNYRSSLAGDWEWNLELPVLVQRGGFMDQTIEGFHSAFSMRNGGREFAPRNQFLYHYIRDGATVLELRQPDAGLGDLRLGVGVQAADGLALRGLIKLPTGDHEQLLGGNAGGALWLDMALPVVAGFGGYVAAGVSAAAQGEVLAEQQNRMVGFGGFGLARALTGALTVNVQLYLHEGLYDDSTLRALPKAGQVLGVGARYRWSESIDILVDFQEDLNYNVSPDFVLQLTVAGA